MQGSPRRFLCSYSEADASLGRDERLSCRGTRDRPIPCLPGPIALVKLADRRGVRLLDDPSATSLLTGGLLVRVQPEEQPRFARLGSPCWCCSRPTSLRSAGTWSSPARGASLRWPDSAP